MNRKYFGLWAAAAAMLVLILDSRSAAQAAAEAVEISIRTVIPNLFPFFLLSGYLTSSLRRSKFPEAIDRIFRCDAACGAVITAGLLGGYPLGAKLAAAELENGTISKKQGDRLLSFCSQAGPSFLFGMVAGQFPSAKFGWMLWLIQIVSSISVAWALPKISEPNSRPATAHKQENDPMFPALRAMGSVCGWVIVWNVILHFLDRWFLWMLPGWSRILITGLLELTSGCLRLCSVEPLFLRFLLAVIMLNFGGLCILMQTASLTRGLELKNYILGKFIQTLFAVAYTGLLFGKIWWLIPVIPMFFRKIHLEGRNKGSIPAKIGV